MARRHLYVLLFAIPALLASAVAAALLTAAAAGSLWLFVLGDNPWPDSVGTALGAAFVVAGAAMWIALLTLAYRIGTHEESRPSLNRLHVALAAGVTLLLAGLIVVRVTGIGAGPKSDSLMCSDYCRAEGFASSGTPPRDSGDRTCTCYDAQGREARHVPLAEIETGR